MDVITLILLIIGGINWGLIGVFRFDIVAFLFGSQTSVVSRIIYTIIGLCALWDITFFFRNEILSRFKSEQ